MSRCFETPVIFSGKAMLSETVMCGIERVVLKDHRDIAVGRADVVDELVVDVDLALGDILQPGDHLQQRALAAPRRPEQHQELVILDRQIDIADDRLGVPIAVLLTSRNSTRATDLSFSRDISDVTPSALPRSSRR